MDEPDEGARYLPDEKEIRRVCEQEIQPTWSEREEKSRAVAKPKRWTVPVVKFSDLPEEVRDMFGSVDKGNDSDG